MKRKDKDYSQELHELYDWKYKDKQTIEVTFQVTEACSLRCSYCYQHNKSPKVMSLEVGKKFIDTIFKEYKNTHFAIILDFIGGEPLLQPQLISDLVDYWDYKCIIENPEWGVLTRVSICSNGTEWDKPEVQKLIKKLGNRLSFTVTIDGNKELHDSARLHPDGRGSYDEAIHAATEYEKNSGMELGSKITIAPNNLPFLFKAIKHYMNQGKEVIHANCVFEEGWTQEHAIEYYKELKAIADYKLENYPDIELSLFDELRHQPESEDDTQVYCGGAGKMLACDPDGKLYPCLRYMPSSVGYEKEPVICGDVDNGIDWSVVDMLLSATRRSMCDDKCYNCPISRGCAYCIAYCWETYGLPLKRTTFHCQMHQAEALANVYYWNKYYRQIGSEKRFKNYCPKEWALQIISEEEYNMLNNLAAE